MNSQEKEATLPGDEEKEPTLRENARTKERKNRKENEGGGRWNKKQKSRSVWIFLKMPEASSVTDIPSYF